VRVRTVHLLLLLLLLQQPLPDAAAVGQERPGRVDRPAAAVTRNIDDNSPQRTSHDHG